MLISIGNVDPHLDPSDVHGVVAVSVRNTGVFIFCALLSWSQYLCNTLKELFGITWLKGQHHWDTTLVIKTLLIWIRSHASSTSSLVRLRDQMTGAAPCAEAAYQLLHIWMWTEDRAADWALSRGTETGSRECFKCVSQKSQCRSLMDKTKCRKGKKKRENHKRGDKGRKEN